MLKLINIHKNYESVDLKVEALKNVNIEFRKSEFVSILGPSGCGKTTLLNLIGGLDRYTFGDLMISGRSTKEYKDKDWDSYRNHSIGFVFQNYNLIPHLNVIENVELALTLSGISKEERKKRATHTLQTVGLGDQLNKKPNQLSGGQMQRVAIARALINDPEILLADEPTGALDSQTSVQVLELLKQIAKDRLIIMVTHNAHLAKDYSNRIIELLDGEVVSDSNPYKNDNLIKKEGEVLTRKEKTSMSFLTALSLSFKNLITKKARTFLTAFAGSIGIIGVAVVLALSNGFQQYIDKMQADTLSNFPIEIQKTTFNTEAIMSMNRKIDLPEYISEKKVIINKVSENQQAMMIENNLTNTYIEEAIETIPQDWYYSISYGRDIKMNIFKEKEIGGTSQIKEISANSGFNKVWKETIDNNEFIQTQYDVLQGHLPQNKNEIIIILDKYNRIDDITLMVLDLYSPLDEIESFSFEDLIGLEFKIIKNDDYFSSNGTNFGIKTIDQTIYDESQTITISGIIRPNKDTQIGAITSSIGYSPELTDYILEVEETSQIVTWLKQPENIGFNPFSGTEYEDSFNSSGRIKTKMEKYEDVLVRLGGSSKISGIKIYPIDFNAKDRIKKHLNDYNETLINEEDKVYYTDIMDVVFSSMNIAINSISYILIAFTSVSLVVSSIMIGIITYVSVIERTREIGVLRSIGARKKDVSRVFNAETIIIGFTAGVIGIVITLILTIPINGIISKLVEGIGNVAKLKVAHMFYLLIISTMLTLVAGLIPSKIASKKDPVEALRSE